MSKQDLETPAGQSCIGAGFHHRLVPSFDHGPAQKSLLRASAPPDSGFDSSVCDKPVFESTTEICKLRSLLSKPEEADVANADLAFARKLQAEELRISGHAPIAQKSGKRKLNSIDTYFSKQRPC